MVNGMGKCKLSFKVPAHISLFICYCFEMLGKYININMRRGVFFSVQCMDVRTSELLYKYSIFAKECQYSSLHNISN